MVKLCLRTLHCTFSLTLAFWPKLAVRVSYYSRQLLLACESTSFETEEIYLVPIKLIILRGVHTHYTGGFVLWPWATVRHSVRERMGHYGNDNKSKLCCIRADNIQFCEAQMFSNKPRLLWEKNSSRAGFYQGRACVVQLAPTSLVISVQRQRALALDLRTMWSLVFASSYRRQLVVFASTR